MDLNENIHILKHMKSVNSKVLTILQSKTPSAALKLYDNGADYVICPSDMNEQYMSILIDDYITDINKVVERKLKTIERLKAKDIKNKEKEDKKNNVTNKTKNILSKKVHDVESLFKNLKKK